MNSEIIKENVMRRVRFIALARKFSRPHVLKLGLLLIFVALQSAIVSIPNVVLNLGNSMRSIESFYGFVVSAFANTQFAVQAISLAIVIVGIWFARDFFRGQKFAAQRFGAAR